MPNIKNNTLVLCKHLDGLKTSTKEPNLKVLNNIYQLIIKK